MSLFKSSEMIMSYFVVSEAVSRLTKVFGIDAFIVKFKISLIVLKKTKYNGLITKQGLLKCYNS